MERGRAPLEGATIVISDGRIQAVGKTVAIPAGATRVDIAGKTIVPGLINAHGHLGADTSKRPARDGWQGSSACTPTTASRRCRSSGLGLDDVPEALKLRDESRPGTGGDRPCARPGRCGESAKPEDRTGSARLGQQVCRHEGGHHQDAHHRRPDGHDAGGLRRADRSGPQAWAANGGAPVLPARREGAAREGHRRDRAQHPRPAGGSADDCGNQGTRRRVHPDAHARHRDVRLRGNAAVLQRSVLHAPHPELGPTATRWRS